MKREDVSKIFEDATEEQISAILNLNSADIGGAKQKAKQELDSLKEQLGKAEETAKKFEGVDLEELRRQLEEEKQGRAKDIQGFALKSALSGAGCRDVDYVLYKLGGKVEFDENNQLKDADAVLKRAKEQCASAFELQKNPPPPVAGGNPPQEDDMAKWRAAAGLPPKK